MKIILPIFAVLLLTACSKKSVGTVEPTTEAASQKKLEQEAKSIDEAADEAAKLIENDARQETATK
jgi:outer membrane biogenesis lipoprotein LolB